MDCVIFDIDGTLSDPSHRLHYVQRDPKDWRAFFDAMGEDAPHQSVCEFARAVQRVVPVICVSGRPADYRDTTKMWLAEQGIEPEALYMRPAGDTRPDTKIKREILGQLADDGWSPELVVDDRQSVVDMWREEGITCFQCAPPERAMAPARVRGAELLTVMVGPSRGGKSTYVAEHFDPATVVGSDAIREHMTGSSADQSKNQAVFEALHQVVWARLKHGLPTVVDATNVKRKDRVAVAALAGQLGVNCRYVVCDLPMQTKKSNSGSVPEHVIEKHDHTFHSQLGQILDGDGLAFVRAIDARG